MKGLKIMFIVMIVSLAIAFMWNQVPIISNSVHTVLDPTIGSLLDWNTTWGMFIIIIIISFIITIVQKTCTDQATLRELKKEQKILQEEAKKYKDHPEKLIEINKKQFEFIPKIMDITMRPMMYTAIPFIIFFRWFHDVLDGYQFFGFLGWIWFYLIFSIIFSSIFRKVLKVA